VNRRDGNRNRNGNSNSNGNSNDNSNGCPAAPAATGGGREARGDEWGPLHSLGIWRGVFLLLRLFGADFAEEFFAAKFAFFLDDDFAEVGPGGF
jgi:hypothetical protein